MTPVTGPSIHSLVMNSYRTRRHLIAVVMLAMSAATALAQKKPTLTPKDYGHFERLGSAALSPDGAWLAYGISRVDERNELRVRATDRDTLRVAAWASNPSFSANSRWLAWSTGISTEDQEELQEQGIPVRTGAALLDLTSGEGREFEAVRSFEFSPDAQFLALHGYAPGEPEGKGADLRLLNLDSGSETTFGNVGEYSWSDVESLLALAIATGTDEGNGVQVYDAATGRLKGLNSSGSKYTQLSWREDAGDLAALASAEAASEDGSAYRILVWRDLDSDGVRSLAVGPEDGLIPAGYEVVIHARPRFSRDGRRIAIGLRPEEKPEGDSTDSEPAGGDTVEADSAKAGGDEDVELPEMEIWHSTDVRIVPMQKVYKERDERRTLTALWYPDENRIVRLGTDLMANTRLLEGWDRAVEDLDEPYPWGAMFGRPYHDTWVINTKTGERERPLERVRYEWPSVSGNWLLFYDGEDFWTQNLETDERRNITAVLPTVFGDTTYDTPTDMLPPHGVGGWYEADEAVLLYDRYDVWRVRPDGSGAQRLTRGAEERITYRLARLPDDDVPGLSTRDPLYFRLVGEWTKKEGYSRLRPDRNIEPLVYLDKRVRGLMKADSADVYLFRAESSDDSPDYFVSGPELNHPRRVTDTNPFLVDYEWSRPELIDFTSESGRPLQAAVLYPAGYETGTRVPTIVYTYEIVSPTMHTFEVPSERDYYNFTAWTQQGYAVLLPDIVYTAREPGVSALQSVRAAVAKVVEMGITDPDRVGLIGHSWGGYQAAYLPTRTNIFAASVAGAPLTDFVSFMGQIHWNQGMPELGHWETGQARMEVPFWEDPEAHRRNSPIHKIQDMATPLLMDFGSDDGVVDCAAGCV